ncbi:alpha/beta hydrolase fold protein [Pseudonocardia dioxanivorans CB1190]|uniref:Alpha/beta hydrolase fold protein n=1 Tax=Pseudonocardia dioxanivorans (strain ATCC 55486 / DSM 44775 / JCM 13855 / CB1190) TaxID=675635 RepID=F4CR43_PSEUX|nr:alpha/beta hydrolase [Pseudonocardia dioxanivorans]AEA24480.1 alpha/beta hydrolase fold protein [Pseudonocardia dioxanivorans CB1190]
MRSRSSVDGFSLAYDRTGTGTPVVLLHGWPGDRVDYAAVAGLLDADVIAPDLRGFGGSDKHRGGDYSASAQAASVLALMDELGIDRAVLGGYDIGSRIAQVVAQQHPDRVAELVVAPPLPGIGRRVLDPTAQQEFWYQSFHRLPLADELLDGRPDAVRAHLRHFWSHWSGPAFTPSEALLDRLTASYGAPGAFAASVGWYRAGSATVVRSLEESSPAEPAATPITVLWPEFDPLFPRAWADRVGEWYSAATVHHVDGVGHYVPVEAPEVFADAVRSAIDRLGR